MSWLTFCERNNVVGWLSMNIAMRDLQVAIHVTLTNNPLNWV